MKNHAGKPFDTSRKLFLTAAGVAALAVLVVVGTLTASRLSAQSSTQTAAGQSAASVADRPAFDVASVKPNKSGSQDVNLGNLALRGGLYKATNAPLGLLIAVAYLGDFHKSRLVLGPDWIDSERFDIEARAQGNPEIEQKRLMIQSLFEDRFKLVIHHETRQLPVYALILSKAGKIGPQLASHSGDAKCPGPAAGLPPPQPGRGEALPAFCGGFRVSSRPEGLREAGSNITLDMLGAQLSQFVDRTVVDRTGLSGTFDLTLEFAPELPGATASASDPSGPPSIFTALQEQLGLKLEAQTGPVDVLVIDHVEEPSEN